MLGEEQGAEASAAAVLSWAAGGGSTEGQGAGTGVPRLLSAGNFKKKIVKHFPVTQEELHSQNK